MVPGALSATREDAEATICALTLGYPLSGVLLVTPQDCTLHREKSKIPHISIVGAQPPVPRDTF